MKVCVDESDSSESENVMQYEYKTIAITNDEIGISCDGLTTRLNQMGIQGWELISILSKNGLGTTSYNILGITQKQFLILKRAIPEHPY